MSSFFSKLDAYEKLPPIEIKHRILVLYEGNVTERIWLEEIKSKYHSVKLVDCGHHTVASYNRLIEKIYDEIGSDHLEPLDEVAYIFDLDIFSGGSSSHTLKHLESIISENKFNLFYTNKSFEFFLLLHYANISLLSSNIHMTQSEVDQELVAKKLKHGTNTKHLHPNIKFIVNNKTITACNNAKYIEEHFCNVVLHSKPNINQMTRIIATNNNFTNLHKFIEFLENNK